MEQIGTTFDALLETQVTDYLNWGVQSSARTEPSALFYPMEGRFYRRSGGILVVGRATNGWPVKINPQSVSESAVSLLQESKALSETDQMDWALQWWNGCRPSFAAGKATYRIRQSAFWQVARLIAETWYGPLEEKWPLHLAWTNLLKIAPTSSGNPSSKEYWRQVETGAPQMLALELRMFKPALALVMTGWDWFAPFLSEIEVNPEPSGRIVVGSGNFDGSRVVVTRRPEGRNRVDFVSEVLGSVDVLPMC